MKGNPMLRKIVSTMLILCLVVTAMPVNVFANTAGGNDTQIVNETSETNDVNDSNDETKTPAELVPVEGNPAVAQQAEGTSGQEAVDGQQAHAGDNVADSQSPSLVTAEFTQVQATSVQPEHPDGPQAGLTDTYMVVHNTGANGQHNRVGYLQFGIENHRITSDNAVSAKLVFYAKKEESATERDAIRVGRISFDDEDWTLEDIQNDCPDIQGQLGVTGVITPDTLTRYEMDVTSYYQAVLANNAGGDKLTFALECINQNAAKGICVATDETQSKGLAGSEEESVAPKLIVQYIDSPQNEEGDSIIPEIPESEEEILAEPTTAEFESIDAAWKESEEEKILHQATMEGSGTVSDPYLIYTSDDLRSMTENDNSCYKLMCDIDLEGKPWRPVGYYYWYPFMGYLDGNGHKITNLYIGGTGNDAWDINAGGLFGFLEGRVENLGVETVKQQRKGIDFAGTAGGIAGVANAPAEIINCYFNGYVAGAFSAGGITGIAYPGTVIENCAAIGTVDMSQLFEYRYDNNWQYAKDCVDAFFEIAIYCADTADEMHTANPYVKFLATIKAVCKVPSVTSALTSTTYISKMRQCNIGGLVGLNYGTIDHSYAAVELMNVKTGIMTGSTKEGAIVARNMEEGVVTNCAFDNGKVEKDYDGDFGGRAKSKSELIEWFGYSDQWDCSQSTLAQKSTEGYPLPVTNYVERSKRYGKDKDGNFITKNGEKAVYEPEIYYKSRVLMKTRENFILGEETATGSKECPICKELPKDSKYRAVTGVYQRGSTARPNHVHDVDVLLAMQESKEEHFILCNDIDFLVSDGINTVQKYWWPVGKTHFSPGKGSLKGNLSVDENRISAGAKAKKIGNASRRFTIRNLTVQTNKNAGFFACFRGTFSDVNVELAAGRWKNWKSGIKGLNSEIIGISTVGFDGSAGAIAGDTNAGCLIRDCRITGKGAASMLAPSGRLDTDNMWNPDNWYISAEESLKAVGAAPSESTGYVEGSLRAGGIAGMLNRGATIEGCEVAVIPNTRNYEKHFDEDEWQINLDIITAIGDFGANIADLAINILGTISKVKGLNKEADESAYGERGASYLGKQYDDLSTSFFAYLGDLPTALLLLDEAHENYRQAEEYAKTSKVKRAQAKSTAIKGTVTGIISLFQDVFYPIHSFFYDKFGNVCTGNIAGDAYGKAKDCTVYKIRDEVGLSYFWHGDVFGRANFRSSEENIQVKTLKSIPLSMDGNGTAEDPVLVASEADLREIAEQMAEGNDFEGVYIKQLFDITLTEPFECLGLSSRTSFKGVYDGNGCKLINLNISNNAGAALFYRIDGGAINNLVIENGRFTAPVAAAFAIEAVNMSVISDCMTMGATYVESQTNKNDINHYSAGLAAVLEDSFAVNCATAGVVRASECMTSGLIGWMKGSSQMVKCFTSAEILGGGDKFGIAALFDASASFLECYWRAQGSDVMAVDTNVTYLNSTTDGKYTEDCVNGTMVSSAYMKTQAFADKMSLSINEVHKRLNVDLLKGEKTHETCIIDTNGMNLWVTDGTSYPVFEDVKPTATVVLEQPEAAQGTLVAEYAYEEEGKKTRWFVMPQMTDENNKTYITPPEGGKIRISLNTNDDWEVDYWKVNGTKDANLGMRMTTREMQIPTKESIGRREAVALTSIGVQLKKETPRSEQTRTLTVEEPVNGVVQVSVGAELVQISQQGFFDQKNQQRFVTGKEEKEELQNGVTVERFADDGGVHYRFTAKRDTGIAVSGIAKDGYEIGSVWSNNTEYDTEEIASAGGKIEFELEADTTVSMNFVPAMTEPGDETTFAGGEGTREKPYQVATVEQLMQMKHYLKWDFYFELIDDLDFDDIYGAMDGEEKVSYQECYGDQWVAIGTDNDYFSFQGTLDGNGHTISNLKLESSATTGLFGYCSGTIKNLKVKGFNINTTGQAAGAICGELLGGGRIDQCGVEDSTVVSAHDVGGIAGKVHKGGRLTNAYAYDVYVSIGNLINANKAEDPLLGGGGAGLNDGWAVAKEVIGIVGTVVGVFTDSSSGFDVINSVYNSDLMKSYRTATMGGAAGWLSGEMEYVWTEYSTDWFTETVSFIGEWQSGILTMYVGGVAGRNYNGTMKSCVTGRVTSNLAFMDDEDVILFWGENTRSSVTTTARAGGFLDEKSNSAVWDIYGTDDKAYLKLKVLEGDSGTDNPQLIDNSADKPKDEGDDGIYEVYTPYEMAYMEFKPSRSYKLMNDIFLKPCTECIGVNGETVHCGNGKCEGKCVDWGYWVPMCRERDQYFDGDFDGNGYTIYGLDVSTNETGGLFAYVLGSVHDLNIVVEKIDAFGPAGGIAGGLFHRGSIERCCVVGRNVVDDDNNNNNEWDINGGCNDDGAGVGGLVGIMGKDTLIRDCYARVNVTNSNFYHKLQYDWMEQVWKVAEAAAGGMSAYKSANDENTTKLEATSKALTVLRNLANYGFDMGMIFYEACLGGLVGECRGEIATCYSTGYVDTSVSVIGHNEALVGRLRTGTGDGKILQEEEMVRNCYYQDTCSVGGVGTELTEEKIKAGSLHLKGFDFATVWQNGKTNDAYPSLRAPGAANAGKRFGGGSGTKEDPYLISNQDQFYQIHQILGEEYYYKLTNDIQLTQAGTWFGGLVKDYEEEYRVFKGHFDGDGYKITVGYKMAAGADWNTWYAYAGLFPVVSGSISNLSLKINWAFGGDCSIVGSLVGELLYGGQIENVYVQCNQIKGDDYQGGLVGKTHEATTIKNVLVQYESGTGIKPGISTDCGLLVGESNGNVECAYVKGQILDEEYCFIGDNKGTASKIYYTPTSNEAKSDECSAVAIRSGNASLESQYDGFDFNHTWCIDAHDKIALKTLNSTTQWNPCGVLVSRGIEGTGTITDPFIIDSASDLKTIADMAEYSKRGFRGVYFKQTADHIDLSSGDIPEIGSDAIPFGGIYDGNGKKITVNGKPIFKSLDGAIIKNVKIEDSNEDSKVVYIGDEAGDFGFFARASNNAMILNCQVTCDANIGVQDPSQEAGFLVGTADNTSIINCVVDTEVPIGASINGAFTGTFETTDSFNNEIVGIENLQEPILANSVFHGNRWVATKNTGNRTYNEESIINLSGKPEPTESEVETILTTLNEAASVPESLFDELYMWDYDETAKKFVFTSATKAVTIHLADKIDLEKAYRLRSENNAENAQEISLPADSDNKQPDQIVVNVRKGNKLQLQAVNGNKNPQTCWEVSETGHREQNTVSADTIELTVNEDVTLDVYDKSQIEVSGIVVEAPEETLTFKEHELITVEKLLDKGATFYYDYNYGPNAEITEADIPKFSVTSENAYADTGEQTVNVTFNFGGVSFLASVDIVVTEREDTDFASVQAVLPNKSTSVNLCIGETFTAKTLAEEKGVKFYKVFEEEAGLDTAVQITGDALDQITFNTGAYRDTIGETVYGLDELGIHEVAFCYRGFYGNTGTMNINVVDYHLKASQTGFVRYNYQTVQSSGQNLVVKNNGNAANTRKAYVKFDMAEMRADMATTGMVIDKATLKYKAKVDRQMNSAKTLYVKEAAETPWGSGLVWNNAPKMGSGLGQATVKGTTETEVSMDVTEYIKRRASGGNPATFGFEVNKCSGECVYIPVGGSSKPELIIEFKKITEISISKTPNDTKYVKGQPYDFTGGTLRATYEDGTSMTIPMTEIGIITEGYDKNKTGRQTLTITYGGKRTTMDIDVVSDHDVRYVEKGQFGFVKYGNNSVQSSTEGLMIRNNGDNANTRKAYMKFDLTDLKKEIEENKLIVDSIRLSYYAKVDRKLAYNKTLHVKQASETGWKATDLKWGSAPAIGSSIGFVKLQGTDAKHVSTDVTAYVKSRMAAGDTSTFAFEVGTCAGECIYIPTKGEMKPQLVVEVKDVGRFSVKKKPDTVSYLQGQDLDLTGGQVEVLYTDGTKVPVAMDAEDVVVTGYDKNKLGQQTLTVRYGESTTTLKVHVYQRTYSYDVTQKLQVRYNMGVQTAGNPLLVKNNGDKNTFSRRSYVQMWGLCTIRALAQRQDMKIKSAKFVYSAKVNGTGVTLGMSVYGVKTEKSLTGCQWHGTASKNTAPALASAYGSVENFNGTTLRKVEVDVTSYINAIVDNTTENTATFAFVGKENREGEWIEVVLSAPNAPKLIIELE